MPLQSDSAQNFDAWWKKNFGFFALSNPLYPLYRKIHDLGGDPDYVFHLHLLFKSWDDVINSGRSPKSDPRKIAISFLRSSPFFTLFVGVVGGVILQQVSDKLGVNAQGLGEKMGVQLEALWEPLRPGPLTPPADLSASVEDPIVTEARRILESVLSPQRTEEEIQQAEEMFRRAFASTGPMGKIRYEYGILPERSSRAGGRKPDHWGSLFLMAVTEHLGRKRGKFLLAFRLLKKIRGRPLKTAHQDRTSPKSRVYQLKKAHPEWNSHLKVLREQFNLSRSKVSAS